MIDYFALCFSELRELSPGSAFGSERGWHQGFRPAGCGVGEDFLIRAFVKAPSGTARPTRYNMSRKTASLDPPDVALPEGESNRYVAKFKATLCKRWSSTRMETLYEIFDLAAFLWALERNDEALAIAGSVVAAVPTRPTLGDGFNYNIWCPATYSHALLLHLATDDWKARAEASRAELLRDPGISRHNPDFIANKVVEAGQSAAAPAAEKTIKWESQELARFLGSLVLYSELAKAGTPCSRCAPAKSLGSSRNFSCSCGRCSRTRNEPWMPHPGVVPCRRRV